MSTELIIGKNVDIKKDKRAINLSFSLPAMEVMSFWSRCGLIANFGASYMAVAHPSKQNIANSLSFILNELLENAVKYAQPRDSMIDLVLLRHENFILIDISNPIEQTQIDPMTAMAKNLINSDYVNEKYIDILTANGRSADKSGIGLLTIINYYLAELSFRITSPAGDKGSVKFSIQAKMNIEEL